MRIRERLAWLRFPLLMGGFVSLAGWGVANGLEPASAPPELLAFIGVQFRAPG